MKIEIKNLSKSFGNLSIYTDFNLKIEDGEICVILGRSGSGKSVLLQHLVGLLKPDSGAILIDGQDITRMNEAELRPIRQRFGLIFQNGGMLQSLTLGENIALAQMELKNRLYSELTDEIDEVLEIVGLTGRRDQSINTLSGGQQKRAAIARALMQKADCLLFDEPTAGLDPPISQTVDQIIEEVNQRTKATMIVVTHDLISAFRVGHRLHLLHDGEIVESGTPDQFRQSENKEVIEFLGRGVTI